MPEPTPSQLKIDGMPETEVLRIEGNVTVPKGWSEFLEAEFDEFIIRRNFAWSGNIVPQESPTGMRLYRVEEVEYKDKQISMLQNVVDSLQETGKANDKAFSDLAEQLRQEKADRNQLLKAYDLLEVMYESRGMTISNQNNVIKAMETRLRVKDSPIKAGLKRAWKWFKSTVNQ